MSSYVPDRKSRYTFGRHPARCNRRDCQARRNLTKHPALYKKWPTCHSCGKGKMYVDWYRMKGGPHDNAPVCRDRLCPFPEIHMRKTGVFIPFHRVSTKGCSGYEGYTIDSSMKNSKHSPNKVNKNDGVPF